MLLLFEACKWIIWPFCHLPKERWIPAQKQTGVPYGEMNICQFVSGSKEGLINAIHWLDISSLLRDRKDVC